MAVSEYSAGTYRKGDKVRRTQTPAESVQAVWEGFVRVEEGTVPTEATVEQATSVPAPDLAVEPDVEPDEEADELPLDEHIRNGL